MVSLCPLARGCGGLLVLFFRYCSVAMSLSLLLSCSRIVWEKVRLSLAGISKRAADASWNILSTFSPERAETYQYLIPISLNF